MSKVMDEQIKLVHKVVDVVYRANKKIDVTLLQNNVDKLENSYAQERGFARMNEGEKFQQFVYVKYKLRESLSIQLM